MTNILHRENLKYLFIFGIFAFVFFLVFFIDQLLISSVLAFVIYYVLSPIVNLCERKGMSRSLSIFTIYTLNTIVVIMAFVILIPLVSDQFEQLQSFYERNTVGDKLLAWKTDIESKINSMLGRNDFSLNQNFGTWTTDQIKVLSTQIPVWIQASLTTLFLTPFLAFFMLRDGSKLKRSLLNLIPNSFFEVAMNLIYEINEQLGHFIRARIVEAIIVGFVVLVGLLIFDFPYAMLLAVFAAVTNLIPYLGPVLGAVPAVLIVLVQPDIVFSSLGSNLLMITIIYLTAQLLDAVFIVPVVVAKIVNLHPVTVVLVIILGAQLLGIVGMIISIPVASIIKLFLYTIYSHTMRSSVAR